MRNNFFRVLLLLSIGLFLVSGCAKDQVKPDEGIAADKKVTSASSQNQAAIDKAAADKAAADRAAAEKAAADKAAADKAAADRAAAEKLAAEQAALEAAKSQLKTIYFDYDSYILSQAERDTLFSNAEYILKKYKGKVKLEGHCDERGSDEYNLALGENRAKTAMNYLITLGVPAERLSIISYGKEKPVDSGHTEEAWAKNRRVEFTIVK